MNNEAYLLHLENVFFMRLFLFGIALAVLVSLLLIFIIVKSLRNKVLYVLLLILGVLIVGGVEIIPVQKDIKNSSIIILNNAKYQVVESGGLRSKNYTMVATIPNDESIFSIKCGAMQGMPWEGENVTIIFAEHSKILLDVRQ